MIRLPDRSDGPFDRASLRVRAWPPRDQIPHATAIISIAGDGVKDERCEHETGDDKLKHF